MVHLLAGLTFAVAIQTVDQMRDRVVIVLDEIEPIPHQ